jgi:hypothetical protein
MNVGFETPIRPVPPIEANTVRFEAGALSFGVEYRLLNEGIIAEHLAGHSADAAAGVTPAEIDDSGVSIHVFGGDGHEYLRFDCFVDGPHYHYIRPNAETQRIVAIDRAASGDPLAWTLSCLRGRLQPMLSEAGGSMWAEAADPRAVTEALAKVEAAARGALREDA